MAKSARQETYELLNDMDRNGIEATYEDAQTLRRAALVLHRWAEAECGDSNEFGSFSIERDEQTNKPFRCMYRNNGSMTRHPIADREAGALKRVAAVCERIGAHYYHQTDPRGAALYISAKPLTDQTYSSAVAC